MAIETAEHVLLFQLPDGGWPKGIYYPAAMTEAEMHAATERKKTMVSSLSGKTTLTEIHFLSNMYQASARRKYKKAVEDGISFLIHSQLGNGGWPLLLNNATSVISFSDNSFLEVMNALWRISEGKQPYDFVPANLRKQCRESFERGISLILQTQQKQNGKFAIWCTNYDAKTLLPVVGGEQEPVALNTQISDNLVNLLMGLSGPSEPIVQAIESAVSWFKEHKVTGLTRQNFINKQGKRDFRFVEDRHAPDMWALYYDIQTNEPLFCESNGEIKHAMDDLTYDGRKSLSWYNNDAGRLLRYYEKWKEQK
ncbi:MAG: pectate lyase [Bacteroidaceae bacterium]|nr:pectate lyase [Bacteroidaceae bacterium]